MNLYKIIVLHGAPKDSHTSIETYLASDSDEQVADWINKTYKFGYWFEENEDEYELDDGTEVSFKEWVIYQHGDLQDDSGWEDVYYGVTKWGWECVKQSITDSDIDTLKELGISVSQHQPKK